MIPADLFRDFRHGARLLARNPLFALTAALSLAIGIGAAEFYIDNADVLHAELRAKGANVQTEPVSHPWGIRDFRVLDLEGNELIFAETFE